MNLSLNPHGLIGQTEIPMSPETILHEATYASMQIITITLYCIFCALTPSEDVLKEQITQQIHKNFSKTSFGKVANQSRS